MKAATAALHNLLMPLLLMLMLLIMIPLTFGGSFIYLGYLQKAH